MKRIDLVMFKSRYDKPVYINPEMVISIEPADEYNLSTVEYLVDIRTLGGYCYTVAGRLSTVLLTLAPESVPN